MSETDWADLRALFPICERAVYVNTGWSGPSARPVVDAVVQRLEREAFDGPTTPEVRYEKALLVRQARAAFADLIGAGPDEIAVGYTTTEGLNAVLWGLGLRSGDGVVTCNLEHSSVMVPCYTLRDRAGVDLRIVRFTAQEDEAGVLEKVAAALDAKTRLLVLSHISYNRGTRLPLKRIVEMAHANGALVLVDGAQSAGQIALDAGELALDFLAFPAHKYLLGPDGVGALYIRRDLIERVAPPSVAHGASEYYDYEGEFRPERASMKKFEMTTHSGPLLAGAVRAVELVREVGLARIEARCRDLASRAGEGLARIKGVAIKSPLDPPLRSGLITFEVEGIDPHQANAALWRLGRVVSRVVGDQRVRFSFALFNSEGDVDAALECVELIASRGLPPDVPSPVECKRLTAEEDD